MSLTGLHTALTEDRTFANILAQAARTAGTYESLLGALRGGRCTAVAIGPVCVQPLEEADVLAVVPERFRLGAMVRAVCDHARAD